MQKIIVRIIWIAENIKTILTIQTPLWYINLAVALDKAVR